jgi:glycosyltransferase involved in cell wall biosynthesis
MRRCDIVYINTSVVADYMLAARLFRRSTILHVHEIPQGATLLVLRALVVWSGAHIIFNSRATRAAFALPPSMTSEVIYNGVAGPAFAIPSGYRGDRPLNVLMLGRINRIKGQEVLIGAIGSLPPEVQSRLSVRIVGSAFEDDEREQMLRELVKKYRLGEVISIEPFSNQTDRLYVWSDIVVVPSQKPEALGRVAIEAMAFARPPLVSAIGGLVEIVDDGNTGWIVPPGDPDALARALWRIVEDPDAWSDYGGNARVRYELIFNEESASAAIKAALAMRLCGRPPKPVVERTESVLSDQV